MDTIARVRRAFYVQGWSLKKIVRDLHVSRNTVRQILRSDETDSTYERDHQPMPRIGPWQQKLDKFLRGNTDKPPRERLTLIRIFEELRAVGYEGGYDAVRRYARSWSKTRGSVTAEAYVPLSYDPGEAYQFDWSHEIVVIAGVTITVRVAHVLALRLNLYVDVAAGEEGLRGALPRSGSLGLRPSSSFHHLDNHGRMMAASRIARNLELPTVACQCPRKPAVAVSPFPC